MSVVRFAKRYAVPLWGWYLSGTITLAIVTLVALEIPQLAKTIVNQLAEAGDLTGLEDTALMIIGFGFLMLVIRALSRILLFWPGRKLETSVKSNLFAKMLRLPEEFFLRYGMGDLISRLSNDTGQIRVFFAFGLLQFLNMVFLTVFAISMMASVHPLLTVVSLAPLSLMIILSRIAMPKMHFYSRANQEALGRLTNRVTEAFVNVHVIQANNAEKSFADKAHVENEAVYDSNVKLVAIRTFLFPLMVMLAGLSQFVVLIYGGQQVIAGLLTIGDILAFNIYIALLTFPLTAMGILLAIFQRCRTALERIDTIENAKPEGIDKGADSRPEEVAAEQALLAIRDLNYQHRVDKNIGGKGKRFNLEHIDLTITGGRHIGLFGPIGSGKSTLFNLITRIEEPPTGTVFLDGQDVRTLDPRQLRSQVGYALQTVHLFSANIRDNLIFGMERAVAQDELDEAARHAQILDEIAGFERGWETEIGEKGVRLSGGQKQRLALARLFLRRPRLLLMDDVLSAVDHTTESQLIKYIHATDSAMIIASHRPSALKDCDEILIMNDGRMVARGTYEDLAQRYPELKEPENA